MAGDRVKFKFIKCKNNRKNGFQLDKQERHRKSEKQEKRELHCACYVIIARLGCDPSPGSKLYGSGKQCYNACSRFVGKLGVSVRSCIFAHVHAEWLWLHDRK